jgi:hypothetical protein
LHVFWQPVFHFDLCFDGAERVLRKPGELIYV